MRLALTTFGSIAAVAEISQNGRSSGLVASHGFLNLLLQLFRNGVQQSLTIRKMMVKGAASNACCFNHLPDIYPVLALIGELPGSFIQQPLSRKFAVATLFDPGCGHTLYRPLGV